MADNAVLSQREIDALLNAELDDFDSETIAAVTAQPLKETGRRIKPYDFRHPEKLSKEQVRALQIIQQGVAGAMAQAFSARLRASVEARLSALERGIYDEYVTQIGNQAVVLVIDMSPLQGYAVAAFGLDVAFSFIDRLLGGKGRTHPRSFERDLTDIEIALLRHIGKDISRALVEPWARIAELEPSVTELAVGPQVMHVVPPTEFVLTAWYEIRFAGQTGGISLCFPLTILEEVLPKLSGHSLFEGRPRRKPGEPSRIRDDQLMPVPVQVRAILGGARVPAGDLLNLEPGDVIVLRQRVDEPLRMYVGDCQRFAGFAGTRGRHMALQLSGLVDDDGMVRAFEDAAS